MFPSAAHCSSAPDKPLFIRFPGCARRACATPAGAGWSSLQYSPKLKLSVEREGRGASRVYRLPACRIMPPSIKYVEPVTYAAASDAR